MKSLLQRVHSASVSVNREVVGAIEKGILVFLGVERDDTLETVEKMVHRLLHFRIFSDDKGHMNLNVQQAEGSILLISQFTLVANTNKGLRPSFDSACEPIRAKELFEACLSRLKETIHTETGVFGADMQVQLINDGPVTFML